MASLAAENDDDDDTGGELLGTPTRRARRAGADMVDELRDRINAAATRDASASGTLVLSDYHSNPSLKEVQRLLPALKTSLTSLDLSYCLEIHGKPLEDLLTSLPNLRSLDLSCCELQDDGCAVVALAIGAHSNVIQNVSLRANRIGAVGAAALGKALEDEDCTLERLDLGDNELHDEGAVLIAQGGEPSAAAVAAEEAQMAEVLEERAAMAAEAEAEADGALTDATNADAPRTPTKTRPRRRGAAARAAEAALSPWRPELVARRQGADGAAVHREAAGGAGGGGGGGGALARAPLAAPTGGRRPRAQQVADEPAALEQWDHPPPLPRSWRRSPNKIC